MKTISIKNKEYLLKYTLRAFFIFENMTGYSFKFGTVLDEYLLFYSMLLANNAGFDTPFDEFINLCDESPALFKEFKDFFLKEVDLQMQLTSQSDASSVKKKTKRKK